MRAFCKILFVVTVVMLAGFAGSAQAALVAYWPFDELENGGTTTPNLGIGGAVMDGTMIDDATLDANVSDGSITRGSALLLDGDGDEVVINDAVTGLHAGAPYTVAAWFKTTAANQAFLGKDRDGAFELGSQHFFINYTYETFNWYNLSGAVGYGYGQTLDGELAPDGTAHGTPVADGTWHHIAVTSRADTGPYNLGKVYIDGVDVTLGNDTWYTYDLGNIVRIGNSSKPTLGNNPGMGFFTGHLDDVAIYNQTLTESQVQTLMNSGPQDFAVPAQTSDGPVSLWGVDVSYDQAWGWGAMGALYDNNECWAIYDFADEDTDPIHDEEAIFTTEGPLSLGGLTELVFTIKQEKFAGANLGKFRLSATTDDQVELSDAYGEDGNWFELMPRSADSAGGATLNILADNSILAGGLNPDNDVYTITAWTDIDNITGFRLEVFEDPSLPNGGPGRFPVYGNFNLTHFGVEATLVPEPSTFVLLTCAAAGLLVCLIRKRRRVA